MHRPKRTGCPKIPHAYRAYELSGDGRILGRLDLPSCLSDHIAKEQARRQLDGRIIELWDGACLIERFEPS